MSMRTVIYGVGAMARVLFSFARRERDIAGFTVDDGLCASDGFCGLPLVPFSRVETVFSPRDHLMIIAVGYVDMNALRAERHQQGLNKGYRFDRYVHSGLLPHDDVEIEENCIILDNVSIHPGCRIGRSTFITSSVNLGHDCIVGENSWINGGVSLSGGCRIGRNCFFGVNSCVAHGVQIGDRNFIGANTLINRDTDDDQVYLSEPGELFRLRSREFLKFSRMTR